MAVPELVRYNNNNNIHRPDGICFLSGHQTKRIRMKYLPVHIITILFLLLTACNADPITEAPVKSEIKFNTGVVLTRGVIDSDENHIPQQDMDGVQIIRGTDGSTVEGFVTTITTTASVEGETGTMELNDSQSFDQFNNNAHFMAFYPEYNNYAPGKASWTIDGTQDVMVTKPATASYQGTRNVTFEFEHLLAQVVLKLVAEDKQVADLYGELVSAKIEVNNKLDLEITDTGGATLSHTNNTDSISFLFTDKTLKTDTITSQGLMIFPDANGLTEITLEFENRKAKSYPISGATLQAGYKTVIAATVKGQAVLFDAISLEPWTDIEEDEVGLGDPTPEDYK